MLWSLKLGLSALLTVLVASSGLAEPFSEAKLVASDAAVGDRFGSSIAVDGDTLAVGASWVDVGGDFSAGAAYVFRRNPSGGQSWVEVQKLTASDPSPSAFFGESVAIQGDTIVVGAPGDCGLLPCPGSAYVFERDFGGSGGWVEVQKLTASDPGDGDAFGHSVAISGDTIAIGAPTDEGVGPGSAYVFERDFGGNDNWGQMKKLDALDGAEGDRFGQSVAISGDKIAVGADCDSDFGDQSGSVYVFERDQGGADNWGQVKKLYASDEVNWDHFGWSVAIYGDRVVVGMYGDDDPFHKSGSAYVFERDFGGSGNWGEVEKLQVADPGELEYFGLSVSWSGDRLVAASAPNSVHLFEQAEGGAGSWLEANELSAVDAPACGTPGGVLVPSGPVSISGNTIALGVACDGDAAEGAGAVYVYAPPRPFLPATAVRGLALLYALLLLSGVAALRATPGVRAPDLAGPGLATAVPLTPTPRTFRE